MQASMPANVEALPSAQAAPVIDYSRTVDELLELYARIDLAAVALPFADWSTSGRWPLTVARAGEVNPGIAIRPLVVAMLHWHFRNRLLALRRHIALETRFSDDAAKGVLARLDRTTDFWRRQITPGSILYGWILPLVGPVTLLWSRVLPNAVLSPPSWLVLPTLLFSLFYALLFLCGAFTVKRGLMLGGVGRAAYDPSLLPGAGGYAREREIIGPLGLAVSEFPLDLVFLIGAFVPYIWWMWWMYGYGDEAGDELVPTISTLTGCIGTLLWIGLAWFAWVRRKKLGRR
jgi:hypothetical protein